MEKTALRKAEPESPAKTQSDIGKKTLPQISWEINTRCNFRCIYCFQSLENRAMEHPACGTASPEQIRDSLNATGQTWHLHMSGGETFLYPDFVKLCELITQDHFISVNTNLSSSNVADFAERIDPARVLFLNASLHIQERERTPALYKKFIDHVLICQNKGFNIVVEYVMYPPLISRLENDVARLRSLSVKNFLPIPFRGVYAGKWYPDAYKEKERELISRFIAGKPEEKILNNGRIVRFGKSCAAGSIFYRMDIAGNMRRCAWSSRKYGNLFQGTFTPRQISRPCPFPWCNCSYEAICYAKDEPALIDELWKEIGFEWPRMLMRKLKKYGFKK